MVPLATSLSAQKDGTVSPDSTMHKERTIELWGHVKNSLTRVGVKDAFITLLREDSTVVDTMHVFKQWNNGTKDDYAYMFKVPARETNYIIRAEHPDYETTYVAYSLRHLARNTYVDAPWHYMRRRMAEEEKTLNEVTVRATKIRMTYRGDTITFNADAFNLPEGSMLDALVRQMDGVELKDDGRILVQGEQVEELTLNGKDFFKGNNKVMLDNLPAYTVKQVQTYHKTTELSEYMGTDVEKKRFVMDVQLKREYNTGWLMNVEGAGGWKAKSNGEARELSSDVQAPYLGRFFALRYTDNSRLSVYGNLNNVNETRKPGGDGEWSPSNIQWGVRETRMGGVDLLVEERDKRWREHAEATVQWNNNVNDFIFNSEQFHTNAPTTYNRSATSQRRREINLDASNTFEWRKPVWFHNGTGITYIDGDSWSRSRSGQFSSDPSKYGTTLAILDSIFAATLSTGIQQQLVNNSMRNSQSSNNRTDIWSNNILSYKLPSGDAIGMFADYRHSHEHQRSESQQDMRYMLTPTLNTILNRHGRTPSHSNYAAFAPYYRIQWRNGLWLSAEYRFLYDERNNTNDVFLADTLDLQNTYDRNHRRLENRVALTPGFSYEKDGRYARAYYQMHFYNVNERLQYHSAHTDTTLVQHCYTMSPELHVQYAWDSWAKSFDLFYGIEFQTPDLFQKVNILNDEDPLIRRYGNPDLRGATNHRMQFGINRNWRERRISERFGGGLRFFRHQVSQGQTYDDVTGVYTYRPVNVEGNWQTYFFNFYNMPLDKQRRLMMNIYTHGDYSRNVSPLLTTSPSLPSYAAMPSSLGSPSLPSYAAMPSQPLSHVNNYYLENRLTFSYTIKDVTLGLPTYFAYRHTDNEEGTIEPINAFNYQYGITLNYTIKREEGRKVAKWLQGFSVATDLKMYSRRGYGDTSMNTDELVWNISLSRSFLNPFGKKVGGTLVARLEGFDLLNQLSCAQLIINGQGRQETIFNTLPRYLMLHLTYNFAQTPKKR